MIVLKPEVLSDNQEFGTDFIGVLLNRNRRISVSADSRLARTVNVSLFPANRFTGSSEISRMVNSDARNDGDGRLNRVDSVKTSCLLYTSDAADE